jgi:hypothetical protein
MRLYDPTSSGPERTLFRAPPLLALEGMTIGILENNKLNAVEMLREVAALFEARHGCVVRPVYSKSNASAPAPAGVLAQAVGEVDFLMTGLGD